MTAVCVVSSPEMLRLVSRFIGRRRAQCWTDCESLPSRRRPCESCRARPALRPACTAPDSASAPSAALCRHLTAGFPSSTEGPAPQA